MPDEVDEIRALYEELKHLKAELPSLDHAAKYGFVDTDLTSHYNIIVSELALITRENYDRFIFPYETQSSDDSRIWEPLSVLRGKANSLIGHLQGKFFNDDTKPSSGQGKNITVAANATQQQTLSVNFKIELKEYLDQQLKETLDDSPEKSFFQKLRDSIDKMNDYKELIFSIIGLANQCGVTADSLRAFLP